MKLYNTLSRKIEELQPIKPKKIGIDVKSMEDIDKVLNLIKKPFDDKLIAVPIDRIWSIHNSKKL